MAFIKRLWKDRISEFPNRRTINDGYVTKQVTVGRDEGNITEEGDSFDASNMNDLEQRIEDAYGDVQALVGNEVAAQYNQENVIFDPVATEGHGTGFVVSSEYIANLEAGDLKNVNISSPQPGEALVFDENGNLVNGTVSTVGNLDDLSDVDTSGKASGDSLRYDGNEWIAKPTTIEMTQAEYNAIVDFTPYANTYIVITDAPNLNPTASDIEYSSGVTVKQAIDNKAEVESGSNSNGYYVKFSDGTMVCTKTASVEVLNTAWSDWGALKEVTNLSLGDFAETFYQAPNVSLSLSGDAAWLERVSGTTVSSIGTISILRPNSPGRTTNYSVSVTAIGRWKA